MRTIRFQSYRQERGLLNLCLNLFSRVQTSWIGSLLLSRLHPGAPAFIPRQGLARLPEVDPPDESGWDL